MESQSSVSKGSNSKLAVAKQSKTPIYMPNEIWLKIFNLLEYNALKICTMVCRHFNISTNHFSLDDKLFRGHVLDADATISAQTMKIHPAFERMSYSARKNFDAISFMYYSGDASDKYWSLKDTSAAKELASSPGVKYLKMKINHHPAFRVQNEHGVTVLQVMKALCHFFARPSKPGLMLDDEQVEEMYDHTIWTTFTLTTVDAQGRLFLRADHFDS